MLEWCFTWLVENFLFITFFGFYKLEYIFITKAFSNLKQRRKRYQSENSLLWVNENADFLCTWYHAYKLANENVFRIYLSVYLIDFVISIFK